jgi:hypothetical protein
MTTPQPWLPALGEAYYSVYTDNGIKKVRRHQWDNHPVDMIHRAQANCFKTEQEAQALADSINNNQKRP